MEKNIVGKKLEKNIGNHREKTVQFKKNLKPPLLGDSSLETNWKQKTNQKFDDD
jgi:hypothetical protein